MGLLSRVLSYRQPYLHNACRVCADNRPPMGTTVCQQCWDDHNAKI